MLYTVGIELPHIFFNPSELLTNFTFMIVRLKDFIDNAVEPFHSELQVLLYPFFVYVYLELLCNGHKVAGKILIPEPAEVLSNQHVLINVLGNDIVTAADSSELFYTNL